MLAAAEIPYMLIGGQAVLYHGEPRFTKDIDITLGADVSNCSRIVSLASEIGLSIPLDDIRGFVDRTMVLPAIDERSGIRVDFIFSTSLYERQAIQRSVEAGFDDVPVRFASLEDVVIHKIVAGRPRDMEDVKTILLKNQSYDRGYILKWLKEFDLSLGGGFLGLFAGVEKDLS